MGNWFGKLDSNPLQKWCQNVEFVRRFRVITMRGNKWKFIPFRCTFKREVSLCSSIVVEETFALGNRGRGKVFCLQILHSYAPPWHITRRGLVVLEMTLPLAMQLCCMVLWQQRLNLEMNCKCAPDWPYLGQTSKAHSKAKAASPWKSIYPRHIVLCPAAIMLITHWKNCLCEPIWDGGLQSQQGWF